MAAPSATTRVTPVGIPLQNGYRTLITFAVDTDISLWEKEVKPAGFDGGAKVDTTTYWNTLVATAAPRTIYEVTDATMNCGYDPAVYTQIQAIINVNTTITETFKDGSTLAYYGYLQKFEPDNTSDGNMPMASVTIVSTNFDPANKVEAAPVLTSVSGT